MTKNIRMIMKRLITQSIRILALLTFVLSPTISSGQNFTLSVQNVVQSAPNILDYDVYMVNTNSTQPFELATIQLGFLINSNIYTGGTITATINNTGSGLNASQQFIQSPNNVISILTGYPNQTLIRQAGRVPPGSGAGTILSTVAPGTLITHFTITSTVNFTANTTPDITFTSSSSTSPLYATSVSEYISTVNTLLTVTSGVNAIVNGNPVLNAGVPPTAFSVTGSGAYCNGGAGLPVGLSGSESGVTYTLFKNLVAQVPTVAGTGTAISFGNQLAGTYTLSGTNTYGTTAMLGSAIITQTTIVPTITGSNSVCAGATGVVYTTESGKTNYVWSVSSGNTITSGGTSTSNTATVTWNSSGAQSISVSYTDLTCTPVNPTVYSVTVNAIPTITGTTPGSVCGSGTVTLGAAASAGTISWYAASTGGTPLATGPSFTTPTLSSTTTYYVDATSGTCTTQAERQ